MPLGEACRKSFLAVPQPVINGKFGNILIIAVRIAIVKSPNEADI